MAAISWTVVLSALVAPPATYVGADTTISGVVSHVMAGDQLVLQSANARFRIRLFGVDAPEVAQPHGKEAGEYLAAQVYKKSVVVRILGREPSGWLRGIVYLQGKSLNERVVSEGHAWNVPEESNSASLKLLQETAQTAQRGLWAAPSPTAPWDWRAKHPDDAGPQTVQTFEVRKKEPTDDRKTDAPPATPSARNGNSKQPNGSRGALKPVKSSQDADTGSNEQIDSKPQDNAAPRYWLNLLSGVRHNERCRNFERGFKGRFCTAAEGKPCPHCGG